ncbi:MAG: S1C family serine protease [Chloroflexota bacterium]|nr:S1C family serine protease [Chloroflexota bacterium]
MIDTTPTSTSSAPPSDQIHFTRVSVALLLLGALLVGAVAGALVALLVVHMSPQRSPLPTTTENAGASSRTIIQAAERYTVAITTRGATPGDSTPVSGPRAGGLGTGVVLDLDGYIVTSSDVIKGQPDQLQVVFSGGTTAPAAVVGTDSDTGIAILRASTGDIPDAPTFAKSSRLAPGDEVVALGRNLSDLQRTVDLGTVNALGIKATIVHRQQPVDNLIEIDAYPPGAAVGGPVVSMRGELIGIMLTSPQPDRPWSYVLPASTARDIAKRVKSAGSGSGASLGISYVIITPEFARQRELDQRSGAYVQFVRKNGPTAHVLRPGDIITSINGKAVNERDTIESLLTGFRPGQTVRFQYLRDRTVVNGKAVLGPKPPPGTTPEATEVIP